MKSRIVFLAMGVLAAIGSGCVIKSTDRLSYERCNAYETCDLGLTCIPSDFVSSPGSANQCSQSCSSSIACPGSAVCVVGSGGGKCYSTCTSDFACHVNSVCRSVTDVRTGASVQICVPNPTTATLPVPYQSCTPAGATCSGGTTCIQALAQGPTTPVGNTCTLICTGGAASMCPGYVPGAASQSVECVNLTGNPSMFQCVRLCNSAADCAPYNTQCLQVTSGGGSMIRICAP